MLTEVIHHIPEGLALGAVYAGHFMQINWYSDTTAFLIGVISGVPVPLLGIFTVIISGFFSTNTPLYN